MEAGLEPQPVQRERIAAVSRPSTAVAQWPIPGRPGSVVRLHPPGKGKTSWRITFPDEGGRATEHTRRTREVAEEHALVMIADLTRIPGGPSRAHETIEVLCDYYMNDYAKHRRWKPGYRQERARACLLLGCGATG